MNRFASTVLSLVALAATTSTPALAQDAPVVHVSYADLDLASVAGAKTFERRVAGAVVEVCGDPDRGDLPLVAEMTRCRMTARAGVREQVQRAYALRGAHPSTGSMVLAAK